MGSDDDVWLLYDRAADVYICPVGQRLKPRRFHKYRKITDYVADKKICAQCALRSACTRSAQGRSVARHAQEDNLIAAHAWARTPEAQADRARRRHLMEGSFAHAANRYHFKRARWRRLWRQQIQDWLIAAVQNAALLCGKLGAPVPARRPKRPGSTPVAHLLGGPMDTFPFSRLYIHVRSAFLDVFVIFRLV